MNRLRVGKNRRLVKRLPSRLGGEGLEERVVLSVDAFPQPSVAAIASQFGDQELRTSVSGHYYMVDAVDPTAGEGRPGGPAAAASGDPTFPLSSIPILHSNPDAEIKFYLDFDGHVVKDTNWNNDNKGLPIHAVPYDVDGDLTSFSQEELDRIELIWERVSEDFAPFMIDITTEFPGQAALTGDRKAIRAIISTNVDDASMGGTGDPWFSQAGGVAFIDSWLWRSDTPVWVFYNELNNTTEKAVAEAASHELGHSVGLSHDGEVGGSAYYRGHGSGPTGWAPIMGAGYNKNVTQWDKGDYTGSNNSQRDLSIITSTSNRIVVRDDDHGDWLDQDPTPLGFERDGIFGEGIIATRNDVDVFSFEHVGGPISILVEPAAVGPNLDVVVEVYDVDENRLANYRPTDNLSARVEMDLEAGTYFLLIDGGGNNFTSQGGYNDYGSLGRYTISGQVGLSPAIVADAGGPYVLDEGDALRLDASASRGTADPLTFSWDLNGDAIFGDAEGAAPELSWDQLGQLAPPIDDDGRYRVAVRVTDAEGLFAEDAADLTIQNQAPTVSLLGPRFATEGVEAVFELMATDIAQDPIEYRWDFGDRTPIVTGQAATVGHVYAQTGSYTVTAKAKDDEGSEGVATLRINIQADLPRVLAASVEDGAILGGLEGVRFEFSHDVSESLQASDLLLFNSTTTQLIDLRNADVRWIPEENAAVWSFSAAAIPPGVYSIALLARSVTDADGRELDGDNNGTAGGNWNRDFTVTLRGDADLDFRVEFADFLVLAVHFGNPGGWTEGDFDHDGVVEFNDFLLLSVNFGKP